MRKRRLSCWSVGLLLLLVVVPRVGAVAVVHAPDQQSATPAGAGTLGVIPGSMATPGYVVRGLGCAASLNSAAGSSEKHRSRSARVGTVPERSGAKAPSSRELLTSIIRPPM